MPRTVDYRRLDSTEMPVTAMAKDYGDADRVADHRHPNAQLIHAVRGVMVVDTNVGRWVVPPTRGLWIPGGIVHSIRMIGEVLMRTAYINSATSRRLPQRCSVLNMSPLMRELIIAMIDADIPYEMDSRSGRIANTTAKEWARRLHVDPKTIHRLFLQDTGITFGQWRTQARLLLALERLAAGDKVVSVALTLGYDSASAFATMFKKQFGVSPSQFFE